MIKSFFQACLIAFLPLVEFALARLGIREILSIQVGYPGFVDHDFLFPGFIALIVFIHCASQTPEWRPLEPQKKNLYLHLFLGLCFLSCSILLRHSLRQKEILPLILWVVLSTAFLGSGFFILLNPKVVVKNLSLSIKSLFLAGSKVLAILTLSLLGQDLYLFTGKVAYGILSRLQSGIQLHVVPSFVKIKSASFCLSIGQGCSGFDGMFFFGFLYLLLNIADEANTNRRTPLRHIAVVLAGLVFLFFTNILRICILFWGQLSAIEFLGKNNAYRLMHVMHESLGWILYATAVFLFFRLLPMFGQYRRSSSWIDWGWKRSLPEGR